METENQTMPVWLDGGSAEFQGLERGEARNRLKQHLVDEYQKVLSDDKLNEILAIDESPQLRQVGDYNLIYIEAKKSYYAGYFYSCCCLIGVIAEVILNMLLKHLSFDPPSSVMSKLSSETSKANKVNVLCEAGVVSISEQGAFHRIFDKRDEYAHGIPRYEEAAKTAKAMLTDVGVLLRNKFIAFQVTEEGRVKLLGR